MTSTSKAFRRLLRNDSGNTAIVYALSAIPLMLAVGAGIDFVRFADARTHLQSALDAAALAGAAAAGKTDDERVAIAEAAFEANMASGAASDYPTDQDL
jgi:Flp pilus assembly protein TadG